MENDDLTQKMATQEIYLSELRDQVQKSHQNEMTIQNTHNQQIEQLKRQIYHNQQ
jgi:hypothetical protein